MPLGISFIYFLAKTLARLEDRLKALKRQRSGAESAAGSLVSRMRRLRPRGRCREEQQGFPMDADHRLAQGLLGRILAQGLILLERLLPLATHHGKQRLSILGRGTGSLPLPDRPRPRQLVFLDTETTGLSGGSGTLAFLLGIARLTEGGLLVRQYVLSRYLGEQAMLRTVADTMEAEDTLVTYNGSSFDLPLLAGRCRMKGLHIPFDRFDHLDLLYPTRRAFGEHWPDCRLLTAERRLLGFQRRLDLPGAEAPRAWEEWIRNGEQVLLREVCSHNLRDLVSLAVLLPTLGSVYEDPVANEADLLSVVRGHIKAGGKLTALHLLQANANHLGEGGRSELRCLRRWQERRRQIPLADWPRSPAHDGKSGEFVN